MSSKSWKEVFNLRSGGLSSAGAETGPSRGTASCKDVADDCNKISLALTKTPSYRSQMTVLKPSSHKEVCKDQVDCSACGTQHPLSSFHDMNIKDIDHGRRCLGSERVLYLCAHAFMTWDQFRREIVDIFPYHKGRPSAPSFLTITYARDAGLSDRDAVMRHIFGSNCQAWEGEFYGTEKPVPNGLVSFQMKEQNEILWYSTWYITVPEVWCKEKERVVKGSGPAHKISSETAMPRSNTQGSKAQASEGKSSHLIFKEPVTVEQKVPLLAERLTSLEIYLCPHVNFFSPVLRPTLIFLLATKFAGAIQSLMTSCSECGATFNIYVQENPDPLVVDQIVIIVARIIGTGASAMEQKWLSGTEIRVK